MIKRVIFLLLSILLLVSCKKNDPKLPIESVRFSKIESVFTPYEYPDGELLTSKSFLFTSESYDKNGNLTFSMNRNFGYSNLDTVNNGLVKITYKYESKRLVEKIALSPTDAIIPFNNKTVYTYTSKGDTAEVKWYDNNTNELTGRLGYTNGTNGKPSRIIYYRISDDENGHAAGSEYYSIFLKYDNNKNIIERSQIVPYVEHPDNFTKQYSYNSKNDLIKGEYFIDPNDPNIISVQPFYEAEYTYDEKGRITEFKKTEATYINNYRVRTAYRFVNKYNDDGLLSSQLYYINSVKYGIFEYTYTK